MRDCIVEALALYERSQDDLTQMSAEVDSILEKRPAHPHLGDIEEIRSFLSMRYAFLEEGVEQLLAGAPVLLGH